VFIFAEILILNNVATQQVFSVCTGITAPRCADVNVCVLAKNTEGLTRDLSRTGVILLLLPAKLIILNVGMSPRCVVHSSYGYGNSNSIQLSSILVYMRSDSAPQLQLKRQLW